MIMFYSKKQNKKGFLMVELIVALFVFSLAISISIGSILTALSANRKAQSLKSVMNNLNLALDSLTKNLAVGQKYHCGPDDFSYPYTEPVDCFSNPSNPNWQEGYGTEITFEFPEDLDESCPPTCDPDIVTYRYVDADPGYISRSVNFSGETRVTSPEVDITDAKFYVSGTPVFGNESPERQPKVYITIKGVASAGPNTTTLFNLQTLVTQRIPDF